MQITTDTPRPAPPSKASFEAPNVPALRAELRQAHQAVIARRKIAKEVADKSDKLVPITT
jgi:hypothetical protein